MYSHLEQYLFFRNYLFINKKHCFINYYILQNKEDVAEEKRYVDIKNKVKFYLYDTINIDDTININYQINMFNIDEMYVADPNQFLILNTNNNYVIYLQLKNKYQYCMIMNVLDMDTFFNAFKLIITRSHFREQLSINYYYISQNGLNIEYNKDEIIIEYFSRLIDKLFVERMFVISLNKINSENINKYINERVNGKLSYGLIQI